MKPSLLLVSILICTIHAQELATSFVWSVPNGINAWIGDTGTQDMASATAYVNNNTNQDVVVSWIQNGVIYYRVMWDLQPCGGYDATDKQFISSRFLSVGQVVQVGNWGSSYQGLGVAVADIDKNGRPDVMFMACYVLPVSHYDIWGGVWYSYEDACYYLVGWNMDVKGEIASYSASSRIPRFWSFDNINPSIPGAGIELADINHDGGLDCVFFSTESYTDSTYYRVGHLDTGAGVDSWEAPIVLASLLASDIAMGDYKNDSMIDIAFFYAASSSRKGYMYAGWDISTTGAVASWTSVIDMGIYAWEGSVTSLDMMDDNTDDMVIIFQNGTYGIWWEASTYKPFSLIRKIV